MLTNSENLSTLRDAFPDELKSRPQWMVWKREDHGKPKLDKVPYDPHRGQHAKTNDPRTWGVFDDALARYQRGGFDGIGFVFTASDQYCGVDLDGCRHPQTGRLEPWAAEIIKALDSYTEVSPSGTGVHILIKATLPPQGRKKGKVEMYDHGRFFTMTGEHVGGTPPVIEDRQVELEHVHTRVFGTQEPVREVHTNGNGKAPPLTDEEILRIAKRARNGDLFARLFAGDWTGYPSQSEADQALCNLFAFYCGPDPTRIGRLFHQSGLCRPKWDEKHFSNGKTYGEATIEKSLSGTREFYRGKGNSPKTTRAEMLQVNDFSLTDTGNAARLVKRHGANLHYCQIWKKWWLWDGRRWVEDTTGAGMRYAKDTARAIATEETEKSKDDQQFSELLKWSKQSLSHARLKAMVDLAQSESDIPIQPDDLDKDAWLLNCLNGTLDLRTGVLRPHRRADLLTKSTGILYDPHAVCPTWEAFLEYIFDGKQELIEFLRKAIGYSLTGETTEQCFFLLHGAGSNGKSTLLNVLNQLFADYATQASFDSFLRRERSTIPNDIAKMRGARFVSASEANEGQRLSESLVKQVTGGDKMTARFMFSEFFDSIRCLSCGWRVIIDRLSPTRVTLCGDGCDFSRSRPRFPPSNRTKPCLPS